MKKRLILLMISMLMMMSVATGCESETTVDNDYAQKEYEQAMRNENDLTYGFTKDFEDVSVLVDGENVLHKGDVSFNKRFSGHNSRYLLESNMQILDFDCGKKIVTSKPITIYDIQVVDNQEEHTIETLEGNERPDNIDLCPGCFGVE